MEIQNRKKIRVEDENDDHRFWSEAPEDLLMEIFIRHPDCRSAARTTAVCRRWRSSISRNPQFIRRFNSHHKTFPWAMMFGIVDHFDYEEPPSPKPQYFRTLCQLQSDESMLLRGKLPDNWLSFLPSPMMIRASCNDLLLVSPGLCFADDLYICNPMTRQFDKLPTIPRRLEDTKIYETRGRGYALVSMPSSQFKVVEVIQPYDHPLPLEPDHRRVEVSVYTSESGKWEIMHFPSPRPNTIWLINYFSTIIRCNEVLFWAGFCWDFQKVVYLDLSKKKLGAINIPSYRVGNRLFQYQIGILHASGGGMDELRVVHVISDHMAEIVHLRVWSLNNDRDEDEDDESKNWFLVHDKKLKRPRNLSREHTLVGTFVHPTNGDLLVLVWNTIVVEYNLVNETYKKIAELRESAYWSSFMPFLMDLSSGSSKCL